MYFRRTLLVGWAYFRFTFLHELHAGNLTMLPHASIRNHVYMFVKERRVTIKYACLEKAMR